VTKPSTPVRIVNLPEFPPALIALAALFCMRAFGYRGLLDARFHYTLEEAQNLFASLSRVDQLRYFRGCCFDLIFLCSYSIFFRRLLVRLRGEESHLPLVILPVFVFDLVETTTEALLLAPLLAGHPVGAIPVWLPWATTAKWMAFGALLGALFSAATPKPHKRPRSPTP